MIWTKTFSLSAPAAVLAAIVAPASAASFAAKAAMAPALTEVTGGTVQGHVVDGVLTFKGIPYAAAPVGELRWRAPQPPKPWRGIRQARTFGADCMQKPDMTNSNVGIPLIRTQPSEDCLYLNVWRPSEVSDRPLPVMVWFYGGGFSLGGTSPILFQGDGLARQGIVLVSFNYRLGRFGFFAHPALSREQPEEPKGNYAFLDQIAALKWVQRNIAAFGGDPKNVTIFGESAGGVSVDAMLVSPLAKGLFQKAIIESGPTHGLAIRELKNDQPGRPSLEKFGLAFAASKGIGGQDGAALARLRALPAEALTDLSAGLPAGGDQSRTPWGGPTMDGKILPVIKGDYFRLGAFTPVPIIVGANSDDVTPSSGAFDVRPLSDTMARFGEDEAAALRAYDPDGFRDPRLIRRRVAADDHMIEPARFIASEVSSRGGTAYRYYFSYVPEALQERWSFGAPHGAEIAFALDRLRFNYGPAWDNRDLKVARTMSGYWVNFAKRGNPNGPGLPEWPKYLPSSDIVMEFHRNGSAVAGADPLKARLDVASRVLERHRDPARTGESKRLPQWPHYEPVP